MMNYIPIRNLCVSILCVSLIICENYYINPTTASLSNGNLFIIHQTGIDICDDNLNKISTSMVFSNENKITTDNLSKISISKFDNGYIICTINNNIYLFNNEGKFIFEGKNINKGGNPDYYALAAKEIKQWDYYYYIAFIDRDYIRLYGYEYNLEYNNEHLSYSNEYYKDNTPKNSGISCHFMNHNTQGKVFTCFYITTINGKDYFRVRFYRLDGGLIAEHRTLIYKTFECSNVNYFKTDIKPNYSKVFICFILSKGDNYCFYFDINKGDFSSNYICNENKCKNKYYALQVNYFENNNDFVFSCSGNNGNITQCIYDNNFDYKQKKIKFEECDDIEGYSNIYSNEKQEYYVLSNEACSGYINNILDIDSTILEEEIEEEKEEEKEEENEEEKEEEIKEEIEEEIEKEIEEEIEEQQNIEEEIEEDIEEKEEEKVSKCELEKCKACDEKSLLKKLCLKCNDLKGYYPLLISSSSDNEISGNRNTYVDCVNNKTKPSGFFFNDANKYYEQCYERCASCEYGGNSKNNNCTSCETGFILNHESNNNKNCVVKCPYYYYNYYGVHKCTFTSQCPEDYNLLIEEKKKCIQDCSTDDIYKYQYNGKCLTNCPMNTSAENNISLCKDINIDICSLSKREIILSEGNITDNQIGLIAKGYTTEYDYTDNHVSSFNNDNYIIALYKNKECISNLSLETSEIDFGECYEKVKKNYSINDNLVLAVVSQKSEDLNYPKLKSFSMYNPEKGNKLEINDLCQNDSIIVQENIIIKLNEKYNINLINQMGKQNIDVFDLTSDFYTDICFHYNSPLDKDIAIKDRITLFFPNITLCENGCTIKGVKVDTMRAICECKFNDIMNKNLFSNNALYKSQVGQIQEFLSQTNILIIKCFKEFIKYKYCFSCIGGYILLASILIQIIITVFYSIKSKYPLRKYIFNITDNFILHLLKNTIVDKKISAPNERKKSKTHKLKTLKIKHFHNNIKDSHRTLKKRNLENILLKNDSNKKEKKFSMELSTSNYNKNKSTNSKQLIDKELFTSNKKLKLITKKIEINNNNLETDNNININMKEYLSTDYEDMVFEDVIKRDHRKFCEYFIDKIKSNLMIINTFIKEPFKPRPIKILLFVLDIDLYLFINALFINEEFISQIFHSDKKDNFFSFIPRCLDRFFYTTLVGVIVNYLIEFFFIEEKKLKGIFKRNKDSEIILKYEISQLIKDLFKRFRSFIIISFIINSFIFYYISCFNNIYPHIKYEWIKSSLLIIVIMQILLSLLIFIESIIRTISFRFNSEKIYKLSLLLS